MAFYVIATPYGLIYGGALPVVIMINTEFFCLSSSGTIFGILVCGATTGWAIEAPLDRYIYDVNSCYYIAFLIGEISLH